MAKSDEKSGKRLCEEMMVSQIMLGCTVLGAGGSFLLSILVLQFLAFVNGVPFDVMEWIFGESLLSALEG